MKVRFFIIPAGFIFIACGWFVRTTSLKEQLTGSWVCISQDTEYANRAFQLLFYKDYKFYYYIKKRLPNPYARGTFEISDSVITLTFGDTNEKQLMTITSITPKHLCVAYNNTQLTFRRM
jgi:hypothetical protein